MSGGHFDYDQHRIRNISESIRSIIDKNNQPVKDEDRYGSYDEREVYYNYTDETIIKFKEAIKFLDIAEAYAQRVDWLMSGDDGEETFHKRLKEELAKLALTSSYVGKKPNPQSYYQNEFKKVPTKRKPKTVNDWEDELDLGGGE